MIILLIFRGFAREKKQESIKNLMIVLNLFSEIIVHLAFFVSVSMHQEMEMISNNAFFKIPRRPIISLSMYFFRYFSISSPRFALHGTAAAGNIC